MSKNKAYCIQFTGEVTLRQSREICKQLLDAVNEHEKIEIDAAGISEVDISIAQLLVAAFRTAIAAGRKLSVHFPSGSALDELLQRAGFIARDGDSLTPERALWVRSAV